MTVKDIGPWRMLLWSLELESFGKQQFDAYRKIGAIENFLNLRMEWLHSFNYLSDDSKPAGH